MKHWIQTYTGKAFDLLNPKPEQIDILDIAHALSQINRFTGHLICHYSVAQHSVHVSQMCSRRDALYGLLHDAHEAYVGDVSAPLRSCPGMEGYNEILAGVHKAVMAKYGLTSRERESVRAADLRMCVTERNLFMGPSPRQEGDTVQPYSGSRLPLNNWNAFVAKRKFLERFKELTDGTARTLFGEQGDKTA